MENAVVFYNVGTACVVRLMVSLFSLRKVWDGKVIVMLEGPQMHWLRYAWQHFNVDARYFQPDQAYKSYFCRKPEIAEILNTGKYLYVDSDTVFVQPIAEIFDMLDAHPFVVSQFSQWRCNRMRQHRWYRRWRRIVGRDVDPSQPMVNMGLVAWAPNAEKVIAQWKRNTRLMDTHGFQDTDELAISAMLPNPKIKVLPHCWNQSSRIRWRLDELGKHRDANDQPKIYHFHGNRHFRYEPPFVCQSPVWLRWLADAKKELPFGHHLEFAHGDTWYQRWLDTEGLDLFVRKDFVSLIDVKAYKVGVEIGVSEGRFSDYLLRNSDLDILYSVDKWDTQRPNKMGSIQHFRRARRRLAAHGARSKIMREDSRIAAAVFADGHFDFVYVDAGHTYEDCWLDMRAWWPKVKAGGCMAGHDWAPRKGWGVVQAVKDFGVQVNQPWYTTRFDEPKTHESWFMFKPK